MQLFYQCNSIKFLCNELIILFHDLLILSLLLPHTVIFGITDNFPLTKNRLLKNHILLVFKVCIYNSCEKHVEGLWRASFYVFYIILFFCIVYPYFCVCIFVCLFVVVFLFHFINIICLLFVVVVAFFTCVFCFVC